jgi:hypothetical protein
MRRRNLTLTTALAATLALLVIAAAPGLGAPREDLIHDRHPGLSQREVAQVRGAVASYHTPDRAEAAGWGLVPGLDH